MEKVFSYEGALKAVRILSGGCARGLSAHQRPLHRSVLPVRPSKVVRCSTKSPSCSPSHLKLVPAQAGILTASWLSTSPDALGLGGDWKMVKRTRELVKWRAANPISHIPIPISYRQPTSYSGAKARTVSLTASTDSRRKSGGWRSCSATASAISWGDWQRKTRSLSPV